MNIDWNYVAVLLGVNYFRHIIQVVMSFSFCAVIKEKTTPYLLYIWEMGWTTAMLQHGYSICVAYEKAEMPEVRCKSLCLDSMWYL